MEGLRPGWARLAAVALLSLAGSASAAPAAPWLPSDGAGVHPPFRGAVPRRSDVVFSSRFERSDAVAMAEAFGATRVEWVYTGNPAFAAALQQVTPWFGGTLNANGPPNGRLPDNSGYALDFDGQVIGVPWMKGWGGRWLTTAHPQTAQMLAEQGRRYVALGARSIQFDDPLLQAFPALRQAGDFNPSTLEGFPAWLATQADAAQVERVGLTGFQGSYRDHLRQRHGVSDAQDYRRRFRQFESTPLWLAYLRSTVHDGFVALRRTLVDAQGRPLALSMNLTMLREPLRSNEQYFLAGLADYSMAETDTSRLPEMVSKAATARALGLGFVPSIKPRERASNRVAVATLYALGGQVVVPWDVYAGNDDEGRAKRYFGAVEDYAPLYRFVRRRQALFDGFETAAMIGLVVPVDKAGADELRPVVAELVARQLPFAYVLAGAAPEHRLDPAALRRFRLLLMLRPDADHSAADLKLIAQSGVPARAAAGMAADDWSAIQPFVAAPGAQQLRLFPRADPAQPDRLLLHVIDEAADQSADEQAGMQADEPAGAGCRRRLGIRSALLGGRKVAHARWLSGASEVAVQPEGDAQRLYFSLPGCPLWGLLDLRMR